MIVGEYKDGSDIMTAFFKVLRHKQNCWAEVAVVQIWKEYPNGHLLDWSNPMNTQPLTARRHILDNGCLGYKVNYNKKTIICKRCQDVEV